MSPTELPPLPRWLEPVAAVFDRVMRHGKEITYLAIGLVIAESVDYAIHNHCPIPAGVIPLAGLVYGIGAGVKAWKVHTETRAKAG